MKFSRLGRTLRRLLPALAALLLLCSCMLPVELPSSSQELIDLPVVSAPQQPESSEAEESLSQQESEAPPESSAAPEESSQAPPDEDGSYTTPEDVALYLHTYGHLPPNFIRKNDARAQGWDNSKGNLQDVCPGMSIGGDRFGNFEGLLPDAEGRRWTECDVNYHGGFRGAERIVFSNDGLIYYTDDHYESFTQLY